MFAPGRREGRESRHPRREWTATALAARANAVAEQGIAGTAVRDAVCAVQAAVIVGVVAATSSTTTGSH